MSCGPMCYCSEAGLGYVVQSSESGSTNMEETVQYGAKYGENTFRALA